MDRDLGLFELINQGDFATVSNNEQAAASMASGAAANAGDKRSFNFDAYNDNQAAAAQQTPAPQQPAQDDFWNFSGGDPT